MTQRRRLVHKASPHLLWIFFATLLLALPLAACGNESKVSTSGNDPVTVWLDPVRVPGGELYVKQHPGTKVRFQTQPQGALGTKIQLFNATKAGWPDVYFATGQAEIANLTSKENNYALELNNLVPADVLSKFAPGANDACTIGQKLYCLRNDTAQYITWYDKPLLQKFGYSVPTTWDEYLALAKKVASEHPGYIAGDFGDIFGFQSVFWASGCPLNHVIDRDTVWINTQDPACTRASKLADELLSTKSIANYSLFDSKFTLAVNSGKLLLFIAPAWFPQAFMKPGMKLANGHLAAALPPKYAGEDKPYTGSGGGGAWLVSRHAKNQKLAVEVATWLSTSSDFQSIGPTYPAYAPAADSWQKGVASDPYFAENPYLVLKEAAGYIRPGWNPVRYDVDGIISAVVISVVSQGKPVTPKLTELQRQLVNAAKLVGYKVQNAL